MQEAGTTPGSVRVCVREPGVKPCTEPAELPQPGGPAGALRSLSEGSRLCQGCDPNVRGHRGFGAQGHLSGQFWAAWKGAELWQCSPLAASPGCQLQGKAGAWPWPARGTRNDSPGIAEAPDPSRGLWARVTRWAEAARRPQRCYQRVPLI